MFLFLYCKHDIAHMLRLDFSPFCSSALLLKNKMTEAVKVIHTLFIKEIAALLHQLNFSFISMIKAASCGLIQKRQEEIDITVHENPSGRSEPKPEF